MKKLEDDSDGTGGPCGFGGAGADCDGEGPLPKSGLSSECEKVAASAPSYGKRVGGTARHSDRKCPFLLNLKQTRDRPNLPECCAGCCG